MNRVVVIGACIVEGKTASSIRATPGFVAFADNKDDVVMIPPFELEGGLTDLRIQAHEFVDRVFDDYEEGLPHPEGLFPAKSERSCKGGKASGCLSS